MHGIKVSMLSERATKSSCIDVSPYFADGLLPLDTLRIAHPSLPGHSTSAHPQKPLRHDQLTPSGQVLRTRRIARSARKLLFLLVILSEAKNLTLLIAVHRSRTPTR
jgi:hypothetical protein